MIRIRFFTSIILCFIFVLTEYPSIFDKLLYINTGEEGFSFLKTLAFFFIEVAFIICLISSSLSISRFKWILFVLFAFSSLLSDVYFRISGWNIEYQDFLMLYRSRANFFDAVLMYRDVILPSLFRPMILFVSFLIMPKISWRFLTRKIYTIITVFTFSCLVLLASITCTLRLNSITNKVPSTMSLYGLYLSYLYGDLRNSSVYSYNLDSLPKGLKFKGGGYKNIILVIDESLRWDYSPFLRLKNIQGWYIYDYGQATSYTNFSAGSNVLLRKGAKYERLIQDYYENPIIWAYAKNAGYSTYLYDNQHCARNHNFFSERELRLVDHNLCYITQSDSEIWKKMAYLNEDGPTFTIIIKKGSHFPYINNFPKNQKIDINMSDYQRDKNMRIDYFKSVLYQSDNFIKALNGNIKIKPKTLIVFTSDHGQNLEDTKGFTHGTSGRPPYKGEGLVPLVIMTNVQDIALKDALRSNLNNTSHFNIFPTLLESMGYYIENLGYTKKNASLREGVEKIGGFFYDLPLEDSNGLTPHFLELGVQK